MNKTLQVINLKIRTAMNAKISVFVICVEAIVYLLLYNLHEYTFKKLTPTQLYSTEFCEIVKSTYFTEQLLAIASVSETLMGLPGSLQCAVKKFGPNLFYMKTGCQGIGLFLYEFDLQGHWKMQMTEHAEYCFSTFFLKELQNFNVDAD